MGSRPSKWRLCVSKLAPGVNAAYRRWPRRLGGGVLTTALLVGVLGLLILEVNSSWLEAQLLPAVTRRTTYSVGRGPSHALEHPARGPYDQRLGLSELSHFISRLEAHGFRVDAQARDSETSIALTRLGLFPIYDEKNQAGLVIEDRNGKAVYGRHIRTRSIPTSSLSPRWIVNTLLYIENRQILDSDHPYRNPAIQWGRFSRAAARYGHSHSVDHNIAVIGGSTLATQLEKTRHSPMGRTGSVADKFRQMVSASFRAYRNGPATYAARQEIICDYINSIPLAATRGQGEVTGLADGLTGLVWSRFQKREPAACRRRASLNAEQLGGARPGISRGVVSAAGSAPAHRANLSTTKTFWNRKSIVIFGHSPRTASFPSGCAMPRCTRRDPCGPRPPRKCRKASSANKGPNAVRTALLTMLEIDNTYALDRLDLTVRTTLDSGTQKSVSDFIEGLSVRKRSMQPVSINTSCWIEAIRNPLFTV